MVSTTAAVSPTSTYRKRAQQVTISRTNEGGTKISYSLPSPSSASSNSSSAGQIFTVDTLNPVSKAPPPAPKSSVVKYQVLAQTSGQGFSTPQGYVLGGYGLVTQDRNLAEQEAGRLRAFDESQQANKRAADYEIQRAKDIAAFEQEQRAERGNIFKNNSITAGFFTAEGQAQRGKNVVNVLGKSLNPFDKSPPIEAKIKSPAGKYVAEFVANKPYESALIATGVVGAARAAPAAIKGGWGLLQGLGTKGTARLAPAALKTGAPAAKGLLNNVGTRFLAETAKMTGTALGTVEAGKGIGYATASKDEKKYFYDTKAQSYAQKAEEDSQKGFLSQVLYTVNPMASDVLNKGGSKKKL